MLRKFIGRQVFCLLMIVCQVPGGARAHESDGCTHRVARCAGRRPPRAA